MVQVKIRCSRFVLDVSGESLAAWAGGYLPTSTLGIANLYISVDGKAYVVYRLPEKILPEVLRLVLERGEVDLDAVAGETLQEVTLGFGRP